MLAFYVDIISLGILAVFGIFMLYYVISSGFLVYPPIVISTGKAYEKIVEYITKHLTGDSKLNIVDAGCGIGTLIVPLAKKSPNHNFIGIEWAVLPYLIAKFRARNIPNLTIIKKNMFKYSFSDMDVVICFLIPHIMQRFSDKCNKELKDGSYVLSNRFKMKNMDLIEEFDFKNNFSYLYVYKINKKETD
ncbi:MAG: methyltransferase domain-containing protein [Lactobacillaceae bacterium]|jgi:2-polyprenyl-3-methyl-5-hydroxy-6-metoxy-1,4-benzoquinol methylase|nr:methyltransferase domain-containing protein [Lactobacillaceae bacterium]